MRPRSFTRILIPALAGALAVGCTSSKDTMNHNTTFANEPTRVSDAAASMAAPSAQMQIVLNQLAALGGKPIETLSAAEARRQPTPTDAVKALLTKAGKSAAPDPAVSTMDRAITGPGGALPVRIYTPKSGAGPFPIVVYYHGGGWVIANKDVYDGGARALSKLANAVVVSVDYRQGPEHKFPAAHDDAYATYVWTLKNAASINGDPRRVAVAGESAGGGLAVATAIMARDKKVPMPVAIVSVYPIAGTDTMTPSYVENAKAKPLNRAMMSWFFDKYLNGPLDRADTRVNLVAADLNGLPPTTIINAQIDPLRSSGEALAQKLRAAHVPVDQKTFPGVTHEFFGMGAVLDAATAAEQMAANALSKAFADSGTSRSAPQSRSALT
ncbi:MAG: alpha/beta hydrolase [Gemmatimonadota bacterium]|nr:alpha/beta hydrolase [Gemmatimonadota bacterium]